MMIEEAGLRRRRAPLVWFASISLAVLADWVMANIRPLIVSTVALCLLVAQFCYFYFRVSGTPLRSADIVVWSATAASIPAMMYFVVIRPRGGRLLNGLRGLVHHSIAYIC